jgi:hypothetical protein
MRERLWSRYVVSIARTAWVVTAMGSICAVNAPAMGEAAGPSLDRMNSSHAVSGDSAAKGDDPCRYLAGSDVQPYTGALVAPPFRANDDAIARRTGDNCVYRGTDGREVLVNYSAAGGRMAGTTARRTPAVMDRALANGAGGKSGGSESAGPGAAVMGGVGPGPWDNSNWFPTGTLAVFKGDAAFFIDVSATNGGKDGAIDLAKKALARLGQPLAYDGTKAVATAPKPVAHVAPCQLIPKDKVVAILGPLASSPVSDSAGNSCTYKVASADGEIPYPVGITWTNGYKQLNMLKRSTAMVGGMQAPAAGAFNVGAGPTPQAPAGGAMPAMPALDPASQKIFKGFSKAVGVGEMNGSVSRQMKTDSSLAGPWDAAAMVNGQWLIGTKHDVAITIILGNADYDKAKALLAAACERL